MAPAWYFRAEGEVVEAGSDLRSMAVLVGLGPVRTVEDEEFVADRHGLDGGKGIPPPDRVGDPEELGRIGLLVPHEQPRGDAFCCHCLRPLRALWNIARN
ncbi:hypothetical protein HMPREF9602_01351 [Cutibacterium acnes HL030PA2]|nr:hypothetical protein HMPREF9612_00710 [Cutibacterium acnes HL063PA2]EFT81753.1 hypothetical protein HMPREF9602_01351 [Cutibacterium acnes HL030PA2]